MSFKNQCWYLPKLKKLYYSAFKIQAQCKMCYRNYSFEMKVNSEYIVILYNNNNNL